MSTWTSKPLGGVRRLTLCAALLLSLAGCLASGPAGQANFAASGDDGANRKAPAQKRQVPLFGGEVIVAGPQGYCIDPTSLPKRGGGHVVLMASCEALTGLPGHSVEPVLITVSVLPYRKNATHPDARALAKQMQPARVLDIVDGDGISLVHLGAGGAQGIDGGDPRHWRAAMEINGHVIGLAVYAARGGRAAGPKGQRLIVDLAEIMRDKSPTRVIRPEPSPMAQPLTPGPQSHPSAPRTEGILGGLNSLFSNSG